MNIASAVQGIAVVAWVAFIAVLGMTLVRSSRNQSAKGLTTLMLVRLRERPS